MELVEIFVPLSFIAMVFGILYLLTTARNRERISLIEKGADPKLLESIKSSSKGGILKMRTVAGWRGIGNFSRPNPRSKWFS